MKSTHSQNSNVHNFDPQYPIVSLTFWFSCWFLRFRICTFQFLNSRCLLFSDFVVRAVVAQLPEFVFLVYDYRSPISHFTVMQLLIYKSSDFRFLISDCLRFDVRVVVFILSTYKLQVFMWNRWHFQIARASITNGWPLRVRSHHEWGTPSGNWGGCYH